MTKEYMWGSRSVYKRKLDAVCTACDELINAKRITNYTIQEKRILNNAIDVLISKIKYLEDILDNEELEFYNPDNIDDFDSTEYGG